MGDLTEVRGKWWNPLSKERVAPGTLTLTDDEPVLTYDYRSHGSEGDRIVLDDTVHGLLDDGRAVTLWDWRLTMTRRSVLRSRCTTVHCLSIGSILQRMSPTCVFHVS